LFLLESDFFLKQCIENFDSFGETALRFAKRFGSKSCFADIRLEVFEGKSAFAQDGFSRASQEDWSASVGVRCFAEKNGSVASGMAGTWLGKKDFLNLEPVLEKLAVASFERAKHSAEKKFFLKKKFPVFGKSIQTEFMTAEPFVDSVKHSFKKNPLDFSLEQIQGLSQSASKSVMNLKGVVSSMTGASTGVSRKIFVSSQGAFIDQLFPVSECFVFVAAKGKSVETHHETAGAIAGTEVFDGKNFFAKNFEDFSTFIAKGTIELSNAPAFKTVKDAVVVSDPWFNSLLCHEIIGHPCEADRALKREAAWAGRAWWFESIENNMIGKKVASEKINAYSDPSLEGYGNYAYDDEGVKAKKVVHIKNGLLEGFLNSRETALILGQEPNGAMRATSACNVPLVRMNNTCIAPGEWNAQELIEDTREGYYLLGSKTPSIGETRQNFKITCFKLYKIENGELTQLYRKGGITSDSKNYLCSVDACANDFKVFNVPNCGKGTPMQVMKLGNGAPSMRAKATVTGESSFN
jgi:TldD protein